MSLTSKQQRFVGEYLVDLNATQAAVRAGYSERTARQIGAENLSKPVVQEAIAQEMEKRAADLEINQKRVLQEFARLAFSPNEAPQHRLTALKALGDYLGLFVQRRVNITKRIDQMNQAELQELLGGDLSHSELEALANVKLH